MISNMLSQAKCVDVKRLRDWVAAPRKVDLSSAWRIIRNHYCAALVGRGVCPVQCEQCREAITSMFRLEEARNPEALLTWLAKDVSAAAIERLIAAEKAFPALESQTIADLFPRKSPDNLFLAMLADYEG